MKRSKQHKGKYSTFNRSDHLTVAEQREELRKYIARALGKQSVTPQQIDRWLNNADALKGRGLI